MSKLLFGVHMHQPVDNLGKAVEQAIKLCYEPFFEIMAKYPDFKFALHSSGWILEKIRDEYPNVFENIQKCNIEFFTGGYYEPILASIPHKSRVAQIKRLNKFILDNFNKKPKGLWLTERVWDSAIIPSLAKSGVKYVVVDDYHIVSSGFDEIDGFYTTEESGKKIDIFPINKELRYKIPFSQIDEAVEEIKKESVSIIFDDLEKFGLWPKTYEWVYQKNWLEEFVQRVLNDENIETTHFNEYHKKESSKGLIYLQNVSYLEMNEWSLKPQQIEIYKEYSKIMESNSNRFLRGGLWKNFFIKYSESNRLHKRMLEFKSLDTDSLYRLQTNDVFWHGAFGGVYLPNLRDNAYKYLIKCENLTDSKISIKDIELSGFNQIKIPTKKMVFRFSEKGGSLIEFDDRDNLFNYQNTLTRREEFYHKDIFKPNQNNENSGIETIHNQQLKIDEELKKEISFDRYEKVSFIDFISDDFNLNNFKNNSFNIIKNFSYKRFKTQLSKNILNFSTQHLNKNFKILKNGFYFNINLDYQGSFKYILELNLHFAHYDDLTINGEFVHNEGEIISDSFSFRDEFGERDIVIEFKKEIKLNYFLLKTFSQSESGVDSIIQAISLAFEVEFENELNLNGRILCQK